MVYVCVKIGGGGRSVSSLHAICVRLLMRLCMEIGVGRLTAWRAKPTHTLTWESSHNQDGCGNACGFSVMWVAKSTPLLFRPSQGWTRLSLRSSPCIVLLISWRTSGVLSSQNKGMRSYNTVVPRRKHLHTYPPTGTFWQPSLLPTQEGSGSPFEVPSTAALPVTRACAKLRISYRFSQGGEQSCAFHPRIITCSRFLGLFPIPDPRPLVLILV